MATMLAARPESQLLPEECDLFPESPTPVQQRFSPPLSPPSRVRSHYRPFSTLYTDPPYIELDHKPPSLKQSMSSGGLHALSAMGINLKPKPKKDSPMPSRDQVSAPLRLKGKKSPGQEIERPSTSSGEMRASPTVVQMKKKRSMASLFTTYSADATATGGSLTGTEPNAGHRRSPLSSSPSPTSPVMERTRKTSATNKAEDYTEDVPELLNSPRVFLPKHIWAKRHNMKLHPYHDEIPYMQAYDPILLESDRYTDLLLQRLSQGQPSFHDFNKRQPAKVLDLGCGQGHWALHAASIWKNSEITGLDIVDITLPAFETTENVSFIQADFLGQHLPFPNKTFDFVRMANLALCIPKDKWEAVFREVRRVLMPGGRLEVIDDQIQFPYARLPSLDSTGKVESVSSLDIDDFDDQKDLFDGETLQGEESTETEATLVSDGSRPSSFEDKPSELSASATVRPSDTRGRSMSDYLPVEPQYATPQKAGTPQTQKYARGHRSEPRRLAVAQQAHASRELEKIFRLMLRRQFGISYRPADRIVNYLQNIFGEESAGKKFSFHIKLAPGDSPIGSQDAAAKVDVVERDDVASIRSGMTFSASPQSYFEPHLEKTKHWIGGDREKQKAKKAEKEKRKAELSGTDVEAASRSSESLSERSSSESQMPTTPTPSPFPASMNAKAAKRLGLTLPPTPPNGAVSQKGAQLQGLGFQEDLITPTQAKPPSSRRLSTLLSPTPTITAPGTPVSTPPIPVYSKKVADRLGVNSDGTPVRIEMRKRKPKRKSPLVQSPGLLVWPSTYIPLNPVELEMHACKNIHTLLGCRAALADFFATHTDKDGQRLVEDDEFDDIIWDYECFRRRRLNWPSEIVDPYDDDELTNSSVFSSDFIPHKYSKSGSPPTTPSGDSESFNGQYRRDDLTHVRTIRVFHAVKSGPPSLLSIQSQSSSSPLFR